MDLKLISGRLERAYSLHQWDSFTRTSKSACKLNNVSFDWSCCLPFSSLISLNYINHLPFSTNPTYLRPNPSPNSSIVPNSSIKTSTSILITTLLPNSGFWVFSSFSLHKKIWVRSFSAQFAIRSVMVVRHKFPSRSCPPSELRLTWAGSGSSSSCWAEQRTSSRFLGIPDGWAVKPLEIWVWGWGFCEKRRVDWEIIEAEEMIYQFWGLIFFSFSDEHLGMEEVWMRDHMITLATHVDKNMFID